MVYLPKGLKLQKQGNLLQSYRNCNSFWEKNKKTKINKSDKFKVRESKKAELSKENKSSQEM